MAERGAYLTSVFIAKPTIFEIIAQNSLAGALDDAAKRIIDILTLVNPGKYIWLSKWSDEVYLVFIFTLQHYYLKNFSASFSETFYGLIRVIDFNYKSWKILDKKRLYLSLILLVVPSYLHKKIQKWEFQTISSQKDFFSKYKKLIIKIYKLAYAVKELLTLLQYVLYLSGKSSYPMLSLSLLKISMIYNPNNEDASFIEQLQNLRHGNFNLNNTFEVLRLFTIRSIELGAFFLQFLHWWNQEHYSLDLTSLPVPIPPTIPEVAKSFKGICPICKKSTRIPTVVTVSGFIYCYSCILHELKNSKVCPVSKIPAEEDDLIRLYF